MFARTRPHKIKHASTLKADAEQSASTCEQACPTPTALVHAYEGALMTISRFVQVDHARIAYRVTGKGPAIVLVNGTSGVDTYWGVVIERLATQRTVVTLDYSGAGETVDDGAPLSLPM